MGTKWGHLKLKFTQQNALTNTWSKCSQKPVLQVSTMYQNSLIFSSWQSAVAIYGNPWPSFGRKQKVAGDIVNTCAAPNCIIYQQTSLWTNQYQPSFLTNLLLLVQTGDCIAHWFCRWPLIRGFFDMREG